MLIKLGISHVEVQKLVFNESELVVVDGGSLLLDQLFLCQHVVDAVVDVHHMASVMGGFAL